MELFCSLCILSVQILNERVITSIFADIQHNTMICQLYFYAWRLGYEKDSYLIINNIPKQQKFIDMS